MGLLTFLGLRRPHKWEPRTIIDWMLFSPLKFCACLAYSIFIFLRGRPFRPSKHKKPVRVVCISDTHDATFPVPLGDLLIHAGDMTNQGTVSEIQKQIDWLASQHHEHKVVIGGNHDSWFDPKARRDEDISHGARSVDLKGVVYLQREGVSLSFHDGRRALNIYGAPDVPELGLKRREDAFEYRPEKHPWKGLVPRGTDILVTHTPPAHHMDNGLGCPGLLEEVWRVRPKLHVFGHVHWEHGRRAVYFDTCQAAYESLMSRPAHGPVLEFMSVGAWIDAIKLGLYGIQSVLFKWLMQGPGGGGDGCLMVNAAMMCGNTGKMGNKVEVVDL